MIYSNITTPYYECLFKNDIAQFKHGYHGEGNHTSHHT
jgi:hypothetical protein